MASPPASYLSSDYSQVILARDSTVMRVFLSQQGQWCLPRWQEGVIPEKLKVAVLTFEDKRFYAHPGVDIVALGRAIISNVKAGRVVSGGSTLTMQVARMIDNEPRTFTQKAKEIMVAMKLELHKTKEQILSDYLLHAPYGANIRGYIAASYRYFDKNPEQLSWAEAALLAVLPNAPGLIFPGKNQDALVAKRDRLLDKLCKNGTIDTITRDLSKLELAPDRIIPFPLISPHLTERIHQENVSPVVYTTIDPHLQDEANFFLQQHAGELSTFGVENACALVIHNSTAEVRAYVGSQDFHDQDRSGKVDGVVAQRSSGSILKPLLYAAAIDEGLILPGTLIKDVPTDYSSFSPSNASERHSGIVRAHEALVHSLNIPAVRLLNAYGVDKFYNLLKGAGVQSLFRVSDQYGLPLILGGAEVTPWDMGKVFHGLASGGTFQEITYYPKSLEGAGQKLLSKTATYLILDELKELIRPGLEFYWRKYSDQKPIAWKTGTSYGHKDAWAVGCTPEWTIVVWVGNFDGQGNNMLSGMRSAGPLLFKIFNALPKESNYWFEVPIMESEDVKVCTHTGYYASVNCPDTTIVQAPASMKPLKTCPYHRPMALDVSRQYQVCSHCWNPQRTDTTLLIFPPDVNYYVRKAGGVVGYPPKHKPGCRTQEEQDILKIIYPSNNANIITTRDFGGLEQPIISRLALAHHDRAVHWYLDDTYLGETIRQSSLPFSVTSGTHLLTVVDSNGNRDEVSFSVQ